MTRLNSPSIARQPLNKPTFTWMIRRLSRLFAFGFGSGLIYPAPGTWGTLAGWGLWWLFLSDLSDQFIVPVLIVSFIAGCWLCGRVGQELGISDYGGIVWDEIVAIWLVLWLSPPAWYAQLLAVVLFRIFDILKPPPIRILDKHVSNGFGVMIDDILAALYSLIIIKSLSELTGVI